MRTIYVLITRIPSRLPSGLKQRRSNDKICCEKKFIHTDYGTPQPTGGQGQKQGQGRGWYWRRTENNNQSQRGQSDHIQPPRVMTTPDTSRSRSLQRSRLKK